MSDPQPGFLPLLPSLLPFLFFSFFQVDILNDLLTFEKMESGLMTLHRSDVQLTGFVEATVDIFYATALTKNILLKVEMQDDSVPLSKAIEDTDLVRIDKFKISQVPHKLLAPPRSPLLLPFNEHLSLPPCLLCHPHCTPFPRCCEISSVTL